MANPKQYVAQGRGEIPLQAMLETIGEVVRAEIIAGMAVYGISGQSGNLTPDQVAFEVKGDQVTVTAPEGARWIELGRGPGKRPPISIIIDWARRKQIQANNINSFAWAVATIIAREGIRPRPYLRQAVDRAGAEFIAPFFQTAIAAEFEQAWRNRLN